jgi:hypothetical protein
MNPLSKPPRNPFLYGNEIADSLPDRRWAEAFSNIHDRKGRADQRDNSFLYRVIVPLGHAIPPRPGAVHDRDKDWYWQFSEEFRDLLLNDPDFLKAWMNLLQ